jgi:hypothetical protein
MYIDARYTSKKPKSILLYKKPPELIPEGLYRCIVERAITNFKRATRTATNMVNEVLKIIRQNYLIACICC